MKFAIIERHREVQTDETRKLCSSIVLFDLASGTPFNQMMMKSGGEEFPGLCGMNLPVLLEAMTMREAMKGSELVALLEESAKAAVVNIKSFFEP